MKLIDVIDKWIPGDWGKEKPIDNEATPVHCIRSADIAQVYQFSFDKAVTRYISERSLSKCKLSAGDVVVEKSGGTNTCSTGRVIYIDNEMIEHNNPMVCSNFCSAFKVKEGWDSKYVYYYIQQIHKNGIFLNYEGKTSGIHNLQIDAAYSSIEIPELSLEEQKCIASVLTKIEQKISLNKSINRTLESLAKQLYDYWFVQFDFPDANGKPYKSSGGQMEYNPILKRNIPKGWEVKNLPFIARFKNGLACQKFRPINDVDKLPVIKIDEMHNGINQDTEFVKSDIPDDVKVYNGDVLFSWSASLEVMIWNGGNGGLNQHIFKVTPNNNYPLYFTYFQLLNYVGTFKRMAEARKTTMGHITMDHINQSTIVVPVGNLELLQNFENNILPIIKSITNNAEQIKNLTTLRDELLPLLMNGQVTIK